MGFKKVFIGTIFTMLDFRLQGLDILPDMIGYIFIFIGLTEVLHLNSKFRIARLISLLFIFLSIPDIYVNSSNTNQHSFFFFIPITYVELILLTTVTVIISLIYAYFLFIGIKENAETINHIDLANKAKLSFILAVIVNLSFIFVLIIPLFFIPFFLVIIVTLIIQLSTLSIASNCL